MADKSGGLIGKLKGLLGGSKGGGVTSGDDWKGKRPEEVSEADEIRSQEEMKETFGDNDPRPNTPSKGGDDLPDGSATAVYEDVAPPTEQPQRAGQTQQEKAKGSARRGEVELPAPDLHASVGTDDNLAAPDMGEVVEAPLGALSEDEVGGRPTGLGLDDAPVGGRPVNGSGT